MNKPSERVFARNGGHSMVRFNAQRAAPIAAVLVLVICLGSACNRVASQSPPNKPQERIITVHEMGKSTRCRVLEDWKLTDGRRVNLLEAIETGDYITIVDDAPSGPRNPPLM